MTLPKSLVSVCLLALAVAAMAPAAAQAPNDNTCAPDVVEQILSLRSHADALGFMFDGDAPVGDPSDSHYQGVQRYRAADGANWLFVTFSGGDLDNAGGLAVVSMGSRDNSSARFRSNRLAKGLNTADTQPDEMDAKVRIILFDGTEGDLGLLPHYRHASAPQVIGDILALPLESKEDDALPEGMVLFFDVSDPAAPVRLDAAIEFDHPAGTLAIARRTDGRYFVQITGPEGGELNYYYLSNTTDLTETGTAFNLYDSWQNELLWGNWPTGIGGITSHQSFNFVRQCGDGRLFMVGTRSTDASPILGNDQIDVYELFMEDNEPNPDGTIDGTVTVGQVIQDMHVWCSFDGTGDTCNFGAAGGTYVADDGELMVYGLEFYNDGPVEFSGTESSVRFGEFRNRDILMADNPAFYPVAEAGGPYTVDEGSDVMLDGSPSLPATAMPWVEVYDDNCNDAGDTVVIFNDGVQGERTRPACRNDRGIIVDYVSRNDDDFDFLADLDNFDDKASAVRWWAPFGCDVMLFADSVKDGDVVTCSGDELPLYGSGLLSEKADLDDDAFGDMTSCIQFDEIAVSACENSVLSFSWDWTDDPLVGTLTGADEAMATFHAIDGPNQASVPLTVCAGTFCDEDVAEIDILNVPPTIDEIVYPEYIDENDVLDLSVAWSDPGVIDTHVVDITWGDGTGESSGVLDVHTYASSHQYLDDDPSGTSEDTYYIDVVVTDKDGDLDQEMIDFIVRNVDPLALFEGFTFEGGMPVTGTALIGIPVIAHATFTDVGTLDTHTATFDWDDGTISPEAEFDLFVDSLGGGIGMANDTHTFYASRIHNVVFSVTDDDLGIGVTGFELRVRNAAGAVVDVINNLKALLLDPELDPDAREELEDVIADLEGNNGGKANNGALDKLTGGQYNSGYIRLERAVDGLARAMTHDEELDLEGQMLILALAAKSLAIDMIAQADDNTDHPPHQNRIDQAWRMVERGDDDLADGDYDGATHQYALAYRHIQGLVLPQRGMNPEEGYEDPDEPEGTVQSRKERKVRKKMKIR